jgi:phenylpropionate dioxygenase-like ring-hydroxylating dioxygenase large terminal subunit
MAIPSVERRDAGAPAPRRRVLGRRIPTEGEGGLFTQSWFPICLSSEVASGQVIGTEFLGGRVVIFRAADGTARVLSAYCPHLGADLAAGDVYEDTIRCPFHHWRYDRNGVCVATSVGDPPPPAACLFAFPTTEKHGLIWAFNGEEPAFEIPDFDYPTDELETRRWIDDAVWPIDPWVLLCNTSDFQHLKALHDFRFEKGDPDEDIEWTDRSMFYSFKASIRDSEPIAFRVGIVGTSIFVQSSTINGRWFGVLITTGLPRPGFTKLYFVVAARKVDGDAASTAQFLESLVNMEQQVTREDLGVMSSIHFRPGTLTKSDKALAKFLEYLRKYPRAHPSAEFIS